MLIMAEVTAEMGAEIRISALAAGTSVAAEVGRRLERLERLEATVTSNPDGVVSVHGLPQATDGQAVIYPVHYRFAGKRE